MFLIVINIIFTVPVLLANQIIHLLGNLALNLLFIVKSIKARPTNVLNVLTNMYFLHKLVNYFFLIALKLILHPKLVYNAKVNIRSLMDHVN
jgi:hypothetical protein